MSMLPRGIGGALALAAVVSVLAVPGAARAADAGAPFGDLPLVCEVDCAKTAPDAEFPKGGSRVEMLLGVSCRAMPNEGPDARYFAYKIGAGRGLQAGACYVLEVSFPDDVPRGFHILNWGCETARGVATGTAVGDALQARYVNHNPESMRYPQSGTMLRWRSLFFLHDRFPDLARPRGGAVRPFTPADGFWVILAQFPRHNDPTSAGAAVATIRLYAVEDPDRLALAVRFPPDPLPRRHLFWREEMADGVIAMGHKPEEQDATRRGVTRLVDWYEYKARLMRFLGINTFCKDLLEFGHNQGWDSTEGGGNAWYYQSPTPALWSDILAMLGRYAVDVLPYYEYAGSVGGKGIGKEGRCRTLAGKDAYTHVWWTEKRNCDVADPDFIPDAKKLLDLTILKFKEKARFVGAWFRPRPSAMPVSFNDLDLRTFGAEANGGAAPTREQLKADPALLEKYYAWWFGKRKAFLVALRDHLRQGLGSKAVLLFTADTSEPGQALPAEMTGAGQKEFWTYKTAVVNDDLETWSKILSDPVYKMIKPVPFDRVVGEAMQMKTLLRWPGTWGEWEWQHACPPADPQRYRDTDGILMTYTYNRLYTVSSPAGFDAFRGPSGLAAVRHYALNENEMFRGPKQEDLLGYFVSDVERAGPHCMLAEARAMAHGDPWYLGSLMGNSYARGFPEHVRAFHAAFLALPALPSEVVKDACADAEVVVRRIRTPAHGTWFAVVNTGMAGKPGVAVRIPGALTDAVTGGRLGGGGSVTLDLVPGALRALHAD